jgi:hypothetical protein
LNYGEHFKYQYEVLESALTFDELFACVNKDIADILKNKEALKSLISNPV